MNRRNARTMMAVLCALAGGVIIFFSAMFLAAQEDSQMAEQPVGGPSAGAPIQLPEGEGRELVASQCALCHSMEHALSVRKTKADWQRVVRQMWIRQAPFTETDIPTIADYLSKNFGKQDAPPVNPMVTSSPLPPEYAGYDFSKQAQRGTLTGKVTADQGTVHSFAVMAHNLLYRVRYMVFTKNGQYTVPQALPGPYEVYAAEFGYSSGDQRGDLKPGGTATVNLVFTKDPPRTGVTYVDLATVYPDAPGRDLFLKDCKGCHANSPHYEMQLTSFGFRRGVDYMRWGRTVGGGASGDGPSYFSQTQLSKADADAIGRYLGSVLPANQKRVVRRPNYPIDENVTSKAIFVEYDLPDEEVRASGGRIGFHDAFVASDGSAWYGSGAGDGVMIRLDPKEQDPGRRMKFYRGANGQKFGVNGIAEDRLRHHIYFASFDDGRLGEVDPESGKITLHVLPVRGGIHSLYGDSKGNVWYMNLYGGQVGKYDPKTGHAYPYPSVTPDIGPYGVTEDHKGNMWIAGIGKDLIAMFNRETETMSEFKIPSPDGNPRRVEVDSKDIVWFSEGAAQKIGRLDPQTGRFTEYKFPVPNISPYDVWVDRKDENIIWGSDLLNDHGYSPFAYNTKTNKMSYFPGPPNTWAPKVFTEANNTVWMVQRRNPKTNAAQIHFYPDGYTADAPPEP
jgi:mono/diheme cytochrome c family protein